MIDDVDLYSWQGSRTARCGFYAEELAASRVLDRILKDVGQTLSDQVMVGKDVL